VFFKRLRRSCEDRLFKYFACGEYGERLGRPHYHAIVFGLHHFRDLDLLHDSWGLGHVTAAPFNSSRARYTAGYLLKEVDSSIDMVGRARPFARMSKKLGLRFAEANSARIIDGLAPLTVQGKPVSVPRYFRKKLGIEEKFPLYQVDSVLTHLPRFTSVVNGFVPDPSVHPHIHQIMDSIAQSRKQAESDFIGESKTRRKRENGF